MMPRSDNKLPRVMVVGTSPESGQDAIRHLMLSAWQRERVIDRGFISNAQLWNRCGMQCRSDAVVIMSEAARPTRRQLEIFYGLFEQGYFLVIGEGINLFGFKKQLLDELGLFDESCGLADMIFRMWENNYAFADMEMQTLIKDAPRYTSAIWGTTEEKKNTLTKWNTKKETCTRMHDDPKNKYDFGKLEFASRLIWDFSRFGSETKFFKEVLPAYNQKTIEQRLPQLAILRSHRTFVAK